MMWETFMNIDFIGRFFLIRWSSAASSRWHPIGGVSCDRETFGSLSWRRRCEDALAHGSQYLYSDGKMRLTASVRLYIHDAYIHVCGLKSPFSAVSPQWLRMDRPSTDWLSYWDAKTHLKMKDWEKKKNLPWSCRIRGPPRHFTLKRGWLNKRRYVRIVMPT